MRLRRTCLPDFSGGTPEVGDDVGLEDPDGRDPSELVYDLLEVLDSR